MFVHYPEHIWTNNQLKDVDILASFYDIGVLRFMDVVFRAEFDMEEAENILQKETGLNPLTGDSLYSTCSFHATLRISLLYSLVFFNFR